MQSSFKIAVSKLSPAFIKDMKEKYGEAELEITINRKPSFTPLTEVAFWEIIDLLDWKQEQDATILKLAVEKLASLPIAHIYSFEDTLAKKLYQLDQKQFAKNIGKNAYQEGKYFSVDVFLYARTCVVANGQEAYEQVLKDPTSIPKNLTFEPLLSLASKAYKIKTGKEFSYIPSPNYETYSNKEGWNKANAK